MGVQPVIKAGNGNGNTEQDRLDNAHDDVGPGNGVCDLKQVISHVDVSYHPDNSIPAQNGHNVKYDEQAEHGGGNSDQPGYAYHPKRIHAQHFKGVHFVKHIHVTDFNGDRCGGSENDQEGGDDRAQLPKNNEYGYPAQIDLACKFGKLDNKHAAQDQCNGNDNGKRLDRSKINLFQDNSFYHHSSGFRPEKNQPQDMMRQRKKSGDVIECMKCFSARSAQEMIHFLALYRCHGC
jgi:hypothetical protein